MSTTSGKQPESFPRVASSETEPGAMEKYGLHYFDKPGSPEEDEENEENLENEFGLNSCSVDCCDRDCECDDCLRCAESGLSPDDNSALIFRAAAG